MSKSVMVVNLPERSWWLNFCHTLDVAKKEIPPDVRAYMSEIGSIKSEAKTAARRANIEKATAARRTDPMTLVCTCTGGKSLNAADHKTTCPRGRLLYQRARAAAKKAAREEGQI